MVLAGEADNEAGASSLEGKLLDHWPGYEPELGDEAESSKFAAGIAGEGTYCCESEGAVDLSCDKSTQALPEGGRWAGEQDCGGY